MFGLPVAKSLKRERGMSRTYGIILIVWLCSLSFLLFQGGKLAFMLFVMTTVLSGYLLLGRWSGVAAVRGAREVSGVRPGSVLKTGAALHVQLDLQLPGVWPVPYLLVKDRLQRRGGGETRYDLSVVPDWKRRCRVIYKTQPLGRGIYAFDRTDCRTEDIFGLFEHHGSLELGFSFRVMPLTAHIARWRYFESLSRGQFMQSVSTRAIRENSQVDGVRDYLYGDRISRIHWKATARTGNWKSKEFEKESLPKLIILLDCRAAGYENAGQFELAVSVAASLAEFADRERLSAGLIIAGSRPIYLPPDRNTAHTARIMDQFISAEQGGSRPLPDYLPERTRMISRGALFAVVAPQSAEGVQPVLQWGLRQQLHVCRFRVSPRDVSAVARGEAQHDPGMNGVADYPVAKLDNLPALLEANL